MKQHITLLLAPVSIVTLAGCAQLGQGSAEQVQNDQVDETVQQDHRSAKEAEVTEDEETEMVESEEEGVSEADAELDLSSKTDVESDWVTYTNEEYGFSLEYLENWNLQSHDVQDRAKQGKQWRASLQNPGHERLFIYANTPDYEDSEGEGSTQYYTGPEIDFSGDLVTQLRGNGIQAVEIVESDQSSALLVVEHTYVDTAYSLMYIQTNFNDELVYLTVVFPQFKSLDTYYSGEILNKELTMSYLNFVDQFKH